MSDKEPEPQTETQALSAETRASLQKAQSPSIEEVREAAIVRENKQEIVTAHATRAWVMDPHTRNSRTGIDFPMGVGGTAEWVGGSCWASAWCNGEEMQSRPFQYSKDAENWIDAWLNAKAGGKRL